MRHETQSWQNKYTQEKMNEMRQTCDPLADAVAAKLTRRKPYQMLDEVFSRARNHSAEDGDNVFQAFLDHAHTVPDYVDWDLIARGQEVSMAFAGVRGMALLTSSLVEGYSLSKAAHVLIATGRLRQNVVKRLNETGQMTHNMMLRNELKPGGIGHRTIMEVRLLHAMVRKFLQQKGWEVERYDQPINQEDMAFTIIEFDHLAVRGMERMGAKLSKDDRYAVHHLWRYGAYLNGVDPFFITESPAEEEALYNLIRGRERNPNEESRQLVHAVLQAVAGQPPFNVSSGFLYELARICLGEELAEAYQLPTSKKWRRWAEVYRRANQVATMAHYRVPGVEMMSRKLNYQLGRKALIDGIEEQIDQRSFRFVG